MKSYWESTLKYQASDIHKFYVTRTWRTRTFENPCDRFFFGKVFIVMVIFIYEHLNSLLTSLCLFVFFNLYQGSWIIKNCRRGVVFALWRTALVPCLELRPAGVWRLTIPQKQFIITIIIIIIIVIIFIIIVVLYLEPSWTCTMEHFTKIFNG